MGLGPFIFDPVLKKGKKNNVYIKTSSVAWSIGENNVNGKQRQKAMVMS